MHGWKFLLLVVSSLLVATSVQAEGKDAQRVRSARKACLAGDYAKGVSILSDLFLDTKDAMFIYNQGRCLEQNGRFEDAIYRFEEYLRVGTDLSEADKQETQKHIVDCRDQLAKPPVQRPVAASAQTQSPVVGQPPSPSMVERGNPQPMAESGRGIRTAGILTAGVGGAALLAGVVLNLKANSIASSYQDRGGYTQGKESDCKTYEALGWVGYGVGAACVATGAVLYLLGRKAGASDSSTVAVLPAFAPGQAGAVLKGAF